MEQDPTITFIDAFLVELADTGADTDSGSLRLPPPRPSGASSQGLLRSSDDAQMTSIPVPRVHMLQRDLPQQSASPKETIPSTSHEVRE
mgnify:CR=1 FL=1